MEQPINTFQLTSVISNDLRDHGYLPMILERKTNSGVTVEEIYNTLLNPQTSHYIKYGMKGGGKTIFQANATLVNIMFYALYSGYLYAQIKQNPKYENWSYKYMHEKLGGHINEPIFISLLPQIFDYTLSPVLKDLYSKDSVKVFNIIYRWIYSFVKTYKYFEGNLFDSYDKNSSFYKNEIPKALRELHFLGTSLYYASKNERENRLYGKSILSSNLNTDLNGLK